MEELLKTIKPSVTETREIKKIFNEIKRSIRIRDTKVIIGGSTAKGTFLKGNHDIDVYIKFNRKKYEGMDISEVLKDNLKFKVKNVHGSRDYFQFNYKGYDIELIPIMDIKKVTDADNITDISPFHIKWVRKHKHLVNEIRLTKAFCKANGIYGAESFIKGFSGYALEILTIHYGGFENLLKNAVKWKSKQIVIDVEGYYKGRDVNREMNKSKLEGPMILVDPVQESRNVAAVLSREKMNLFMIKAKSFLKSKEKRHFFIKKSLKLNDLKEKYKHLIVLEAKPLEGKRDVIGAKLLKCYEYFIKKLEEHDFELIDSDWHWDSKALFWFALKNLKIEGKVKHYGPPKNQRERIKSFREKWGNVKYEGETSYVFKDREFNEVNELFLKMLEDDYVNSKVGELKTLNI